MIVALIALAVAMGGSAYAGIHLSKNSVHTDAIKYGAVTNSKIKKRTITGSRIRPNSISGARIRPNSITGREIDEATLGLSAANGSQIVSFNVVSQRGDAAKTLAVFGPWKLIGRCEKNRDNIDAFIDVESSTAGTFTPENDDAPVGTGNWVRLLNAEPDVRDVTTQEPYFMDPATGISALDGDGEPVGIWTGFPGANCRFVGSFPVTRP